MKEDAQSGLSIGTLLIASASAVAAALIVPLFWQRGTLIATAITPIVVSLVSELLQRPKEHAGRAVRLVRPATRPGEPEPFEPVDPSGRVQPDEGEPAGAPAGRLAGDDPFGLRRADVRRRRMRVAALTGVLAFVAAAAVLTFSELVVFGSSVNRESARTTLFGGGRDGRDGGKHPTPTPTETAAPSRTPTPSPSPSPTPTPTPTESAVPSTTATPTPAPTGPPGATAVPSPAPAPATPGPTGT